MKTPSKPALVLLCVAAAAPGAIVAQNEAKVWKSSTFLDRVDGWIQYKATLVSPDDANTPVLRDVTIAYR